jgi:hypothetical protein
MPSRVPAAAVAEASDVTDEHLVRAEWVAVGASAWGFGYPSAVGVANELTFVHPRTVLRRNESRGRYSGEVGLPGCVNTVCATLHVIVLVGDRRVYEGGSADLVYDYQVGVCNRQAELIARLVGRGVGGRGGR